MISACVAVVATLLIFAAPLIVAPLANATFATISGESGGSLGLQANPSRAIDIQMDRLEMTSSVHARIDHATQALAMWREHPIVGIGLGTFYHAELAKGPELASTIHTTLLWLLVETGIVGFLLFSIFGIALLRALLRRPLNEVEPAQIAVFLALITIGAASIGTEILFQRYLWFLIGLGLAVSKVPSLPSKSAVA
jgi:O-antigen ligase